MRRSWFTFPRLRSGKPSGAMAMVRSHSRVDGAEEEQAVRDDRPAAACAPASDDRVPVTFTVPSHRGDLVVGVLEPCGPEVAER